ncbi:AraC family transcriptional regulator [Paenibacillus marinisediminis]
MTKNTIERAVQYIEAHLCEPLRAEDVAREVHISHSHFHRIFMALTGETIGNYIRKRRLTEAARELLGTNRPIMDIAMDYQFESQAAFSRSFKRVYGTAPYQFRARGTRPVMSEKGQLLGKRLYHRLDHITIEPTIQVLERSIHVIGTRGWTSLEHNRIPDIWDELITRRQEIAGIKDHRTGYGICRATSALSFQEFTEQSPFEQMAGYEVYPESTVPDKMCACVLQPGRYAVFEHLGPTKVLPASYEYIWGTWLSNTDLSLDCRDDFELYGPEFKGRESDESKLYIYIPII